MTITSDDFQPDGLPTDCSVGASDNKFGNAFTTPVILPGAPTDAVVTLTGQLVSGEVLDHDHGEYVLTDDPRWQGVSQVPTTAEVTSGHADSGTPL